MLEEKLETAVGKSRKWDAREAGKEVARSTIEKLTTPPDFFLLFSTIHYEKHGGFEEFLKGVWDVLPKDTKLKRLCQVFSLSTFVSLFACD